MVLRASGAAWHALRVGNVTLPTPVFVAGGALCLLAGYLVGSVLGSDAPARTTATVVSYSPKTSQLCLEGEAVKDRENLTAEGHLCGTWSHANSSVRPREGDEFRFLVMDREIAREGGQRGVVIFGTVLE